MSQQVNDFSEFSSTEGSAHDREAGQTRLTADEIRTAYRFFLGREPESESVVAAWRSHNYEQLRRSFLNSPEFRRNHPEIFAPSPSRPVNTNRRVRFQRARFDKLT